MLTSSSVIVSFHDLTAENYELCEWFLAEIGKIGIGMASLLAVPCWHGRSLSFGVHDYCAWLREKEEDGNDIALHGFLHIDENSPGLNPYRWLVSRIYTSGEGEFYSIDEAGAMARLEHGRDILHECGLDVKGFVAPAWLMSRDCEEALIQAGFEYTTSLTEIRLLQSNETLYAPAVAFSTRSFLRRSVSCLWGAGALSITGRVPILRIAVHPADFKYPCVQKTLFRMLEKAVESRTPRTYSDFIKQR